MTGGQGDPQNALLQTPSILHDLMDHGIQTMLREGTDDLLSLQKDLNPAQDNT